MATWAAATTGMKQQALIRKGLDAIVLIAPVSTAIPTTLTDATGSGIVLPATGYEPLGYHSEDGLTFGREVETSDITSHGSVDPTRSDIRRITSTMSVTCQETNLQTLAVSMNMDLSGVTTPSSGEIVIAEPSRPTSIHYRLLSISVDDADAGEVYIARLFPRAKVTELGEQTWSDGDEAMTRELTFTAYLDATAGYSVRHYFCGPGWKDIVDQAGFPAPAP